MKVIFDFDGTLCDITHRVKYIESNNKDYDAFFRACIDDVPNYDVINCLKSHVRAGDQVEIWSGRSNTVREESIEWLNKHIGRCWHENAFGESFTWAGQLLTRMRPATDYQPDDNLKQSWLKHEIETTGSKPDIVYDDRRRVVEMWRANGITCAQVAPGDFDDRRKFKQPRDPQLIVMVGGSGSGKSTWIRESSTVYHVVSSDTIRENQFPSENGINSAAYTPAGFAATFGTAHALVKTLLDGGIDVVYDATNIRRRDRIDFLKAVDIIDKDLNRLRDNIRVTYMVVERSLEDKLASFEQDPRYQTNQEIIRKHHNTYMSNRKDIMQGDGIVGIEVETGDAS